MFETEEKIFTERDLLLGILWEGDCQLHTNRPGMAKTPFGSTIVHGNSVTSMVLGRFLKHTLKVSKQFSLKELEVNYLAPVHIGDLVKGFFVLENRNSFSHRQMLNLSFEIFKNKEVCVSKGTVLIEVDAELNFE